MTYAEQPSIIDLGGSRPGRPHVVLTTEGTYPHFKGGVSTWCHILLQQMPDVDFTLWALMMNPFVASQYPLPPNVRHLAGVPMWGIEEPAEYSTELPATKVVSLSRHSSERRVHEDFVPLLEGMLTEIASPDFDAVHFAGTLHNLQRWFASHDYRATFRSRSTWEAAKAVLMRSAGQDTGDEEISMVDPERRPDRGEVRRRLHEMRHRPPSPPGGAATTRHLPTLNDATEGLRWLYRLLMPLNFPIVQGDLVHSSGAAFCGIPAILSKLEHGTPFLLTEHGVYMREQYLAISRYGYPFYLKKFVVQMIAAISRACYALADQVSPVCQYNARWELRNGVDPEKVKVIYNGVDPAVFVPRAVPRRQGPTVVTLARIDPLKDIETFLHVADATRQRLPGVQFLHFGPVVDREYNEKVQALWRSLRLEDTVHFMGLTDDPAGAMNQGDVVVLTSMSEAFPYTVVEALMCGRPVVATDVGGVREALEGTGLLARPGDVSGLAEGVVRLLSLDPAARQELSDACRTRALNYFSLDNSIQAYHQTYMELAARGHQERLERQALVAAAAAARPAPHLEALGEQAAPSWLSGQPGHEAPAFEPAGYQPSAFEPAAYEPVPGYQPEAEPELVDLRRLEAEPYPAEPYTPEPYVSEPYVSEPYVSEPYAGGPGWSEPLVAGPAATGTAAPGTAAPGGTAELVLLRRRLADPNPEVRTAAAHELAGVGDLPDVLTLLAEALKDPSPMVRMAALQNIARLLGRQQEAG